MTTFYRPYARAEQTTAPVFVSPEQYQRMQAEKQAKDLQAYGELELAADAFVIQMLVNEQDGAQKNMAPVGFSSKTTTAALTDVEKQATARQILNSLKQIIVEQTGEGFVQNIEPSLSSSLIAKFSEAYTQLMWVRMQLNSGIEPKQIIKQMQETA